MNIQKATCKVLKLNQLNKVSFSLLNRNSFDYSNYGDYIVNGEIKLKNYVMPHPKWNDQQVKEMEFLTPSAHTSGDKFAKYFASSIQIMNDTLSGYYFRKFSRDPETLKKTWVSRILYMQNVAGVPGFVGALGRHLKSLRKLDEDEEVGDIHGLLKESENERIHLLIFMAIHKPQALYRLGMVASQVLYQFIFGCIYAISPRVLHRIMANLEINQIKALTELIDGIERKKTPLESWKSKKASQMGQDYWELNDDATYLDMVYYLRKDKEVHRDYNNEIADDYINKTPMSQKFIDEKKTQDILQHL